MREHPGRITLQVRGAGDAEAVARALNCAVADLVKLDINYVTQALPAPTGPFIWVDANSVHPDRLGAITDILIRHLTKEGVTDAVIAVPKIGGPLTDYQEGLDTVPRAATLRLYPPAPARVYKDPRAEIPSVWLDEAVRWLGASVDEATEVRAAVESMEFPVALRDVRALLDVCRTTRPVSAAMVVGDLRSRLRGASGAFYSHVPCIALAAGGPEADDDELVAAMAALVEVARRLARGVGYASISVEPTFGPSGRASTVTAWMAEGGEHPDLISPLCDEFVFDGFPYQILGPGHLRRLGAMPSGAVPLDNGRVELSVGDPRGWLLDDWAYRPHAWRSITSRRRDPSLQELARRLLDPCLPRQGETGPVRQERWRPHE